MQWWCCFLQRNKVSARQELVKHSLTAPAPAGLICRAPAHKSKTRRGIRDVPCPSCLPQPHAGLSRGSRPSQARTRCCTLCLEALSAFAWGKGAAGGGMGKNIQTTMTWIDLSALQHHRPASRWHKSNSGSDLSLQERKRVSESTEDPF